MLTPQNIEFEIIPSNNTNLSDINQLPVLIDNETKKYNGYNEIIRFIESKYFSTSTKLSLVSYLPSDSLKTTKEKVN